MPEFFFDVVRPAPGRIRVGWVQQQWLNRVSSFALASVDQHARIEDAGGVERTLRGAQGGGERLGALAVVPGPVRAADGQGDRGFEAEVARSRPVAG